MFIIVERVIKETFGDKVAVAFKTLLGYLKKPAEWLIETIKGVLKKVVSCFHIIFIPPSTEEQLSNMEIRKL